MRYFLLLVITVGSACTSHTPRTTLPTTYTCNDITVVRRGDTLEAGHGTRLGWRDHEGAHFVAWPLTPTDVETVEYIVPNDPRQDAIQHTYDTSKGSAKTDWRVTKRQTCTANGGYNDALARFMNGATLDEVAAELPSASREEASELVNHALIALQKKYRRAR